MKIFTWRARCWWCSATRTWRSRWRLWSDMCGACHARATQEAGLYLQSGGPPYAKGSRLGFREG